MFYIVFVIFLFVALVAMHILFCRLTKKPGLHAKVFVLMAMAFLGVYALVVFFLPHLGWLDPHCFWGLPFKITSGTIFVLLVPVYLCFYVLTQLTSPSKRILLGIAQQGKLSREEILKIIQKEEFIMTRLKQLYDSGCVELVQGRYRLTMEGRKIASFLNIMQVFLGRKVGG